MYKQEIKQCPLQQRMSQRRNKKAIRKRFAVSDHVDTGCPNLVTRSVQGVICVKSAERPQADNLPSHLKDWKRKSTLNLKCSRKDIMKIRMQIDETEKNNRGARWSQTPVGRCLQRPRAGNRPDVHRLMSGSTKCGLSLKQTIIHPRRGLRDWDGPQRG